MRNRYWFVGMQTLATALLMLVLTSSGYSQSLNRKQLPTLSLVKALQTAPGDVTQRDTILVAEPGPGSKRYLALPIFIKNCLDSLTNPVSGYPGEPIYSFKFKLQYNNRLLRALGVQKHGILPADSNISASSFNFSWDVDADPTYKLSTVGAPSANGDRIMVTASSATPLPLSPKSNPLFSGCQFRDTTVLVYVLFEVIGQANGGVAGVNRDQIILSRDSIMWNEYRPSAVDANMVTRGFENFQAGVAPTPIVPITYPNNYGSAVVQITPRPRIDLLPPSQVVTINSDISNYQLVRPLQTYFGNQNRIFRNILLVNGVPNTVLRNVEVETDAPWLRVDTNNPNQPPGVGQGGDEVAERGLFIREVSGQYNFNIVANPSLLPSSDGGIYPTPGIYTGYITVRSEDALNSAVRLRVDLLITRNPLEPDMIDSTESTRPNGIQFLLRNSAPRPDTTYLTFGTGLHATDSIDTLFGEAEAPTPFDSTRFGARFFPPSYVATHPNFNGLIDTRQFTPTPTNGESSIDIRNYKTNTTLTYCVRFSAGSPQNYPVVLEYDVRDLPTGGLAYIRDNQNGQFMSIDLRQGTNIGGFKRAITIKDASVTGFCFEYTVPSVVQFPEINRGWNLVSLPVAPSDAHAGVVFPNISSSKPLMFASGTYIPEDSLEVGRGYFVKYGETIDRSIAGTQIRQIREQSTAVQPFPFIVKVFYGWNTVGALSYPTTTEFMGFGPLPGKPTPHLVADVYGYSTDKGYIQTSIIAPGFGYWIKIDRDGYYRLDAPPGSFKASAAPAINADYKVLNKLTVADNGQKVGTLYFGETGATLANHELPPVPGRDLFDVRFSNNSFVSATATAGAEHVVRVQGVQFPVVLSVNSPDANYIVSDATTGEVFGTFTQGQAGAVRVTNPASTTLKLTAVASSSMELGSAFPNPTSAKASFDITMPTEQNVTVVLYSSLGNAVRQLFSGNIAGRQTVEFTTAGLPSGVYYYKMTTGSGFTQMRQVVISK